MVRMKGLEPPRLAAPDPKSGVATNYTTSAVKNFFSFILVSANIQTFPLLPKVFYIFFKLFRIRGHYNLLYLHFQKYSRKYGTNRNN